MEDIIRNWIKKKLDSTEDIHIHIIQYDYGIHCYLVWYDLYIEIRKYGH